MSEEKIQAFRVQFYDEWLGVEDFDVVRAASEEEARAIFEEDTMEDRHEIRDVELAYSLDKNKVEDIVD